jgi:holdfast attachment protein HfaA
VWGSLQIRLPVAWTEAEFMFEANPAASVRKPPAFARLAWTCLAVAVVFTLTIAGAAQAQSMNASSSQFNSGWGGSGALNSPVNIGTRDANNNQVFVNGILETPQGSIFSTASGVSQSSTSGGVGASGLATAIGNNLNVVVQGSWNRVTVDSTQINNGAVTANTSLNGQIKLDGP